MTGRVTLIQSVTTSIPSYSIQTTKIPKTICKAIDKSNRAFLWESTAHKRKVHLIKGDQVCQPKEKGGLGLRKMEQANEALLAKLGWRVLIEGNTLWASVIQNQSFDGKNSL